MSELRRRALADGHSFGGPITTERSRDGSVVVLDIPLAGSGTDAQSNAALAKLREHLIPSTLGTVPGLTAQVTGDTASSADFSALLSSRMPWVFAFVLGSAFLLLLVTFRSLVIPLTAIGLNLLSVGAAYGVLVWIFQDGHLEGLLGFQSHRSDHLLAAAVPVRGPVRALDGLPRVHPHPDQGGVRSRHADRRRRSRAGSDHGQRRHERGGGDGRGVRDLRDAVVLDFKQMGVGLAFAVAIDATIIRGVLLPATMKLLGERNWYLPRSLSWLPRCRRTPGARAERGARSWRAVDVAARAGLDAATWRSALVTSVVAFTIWVVVLSVTLSLCRSSHRPAVDRAVRVRVPLDSGTRSTERRTGAGDTAAWPVPRPRWGQPPGPALAPPSAIRDLARPGVAGGALAGRVRVRGCRRSRGRPGCRPGSRCPPGIGRFPTAAPTSASGTWTRCRSVRGDGRLGRAGRRHRSGCCVLMAFGESRLAAALLGPRADDAPDARAAEAVPAQPGRRATDARAALGFQAALSVLLGAACTLIWALTGASYFWPQWVWLGVGLPLALHGGSAGRSRRRRDRGVLAIQVGAFRGDRGFDDRHLGVERRRLVLADLGDPSALAVAFGAHWVIACCGGAVAAARGAGRARRRARHDPPAAPSTFRTPSCAGSSATCTTARRRGWSRSA